MGGGDGCVRWEDGLQEHEWTRGNCITYCSFYPIKKKKMDLLRVDSSALPKMPVKWFKVTFDPDDYRVRQKMLDFADYVSDREILNADNHLIQSFSSSGSIGEEAYERIVKTNSKI